MTSLVITPRVAVLTLQPVSGPTIVLQAVARPQITFAAAGVQGIPGSLARYTHTQISPLTTWTVAHNLGFRPNITITTTGGQEVWGEVLHLSANTLTVSFDTPLAGAATCI
jgi:hypothetical protein